MTASKTLSVLAVIPARLSSHRLPGKVLLPLAGRPMILHVLERARRAESVDRVIVATDDPTVQRVVQDAGGEAWLTSADHASGTDRVWEVVMRIRAEGGPDPAVVVDVQGDEPLLDPAHVEALIATFSDPRVAVATVAAPLAEGADDPSVVKVVTDLAGDALYFSRSRIPASGAVLQHIGLYAFRTSALEDFAARSRGPLERAERLEQLRFLEYGHTVRVVQVAVPSPSVDTPADLEHVRSLIETGDTP